MAKATKAEKMSLQVPAEILKWRSYADPINASIMERWKNGDPRRRTA